MNDLYLNKNKFTKIDENKIKIFNNLSDAIQCQTISNVDESLMNKEEFKKLHQIIQSSYQNVMENCEFSVINDMSLLIHIKGQNPKLKAALFMAHMDVVGVVKGTEQDWTHEPFSGFIDDEYIWGRGTIDTKSLVMGELEAINYLLGEGYKPKRDMYFCFGHDEETMGKKGQLAIKNILKDNNVKLEYVFDEGGGFDKASEFGTGDKILAKINVFEKGYADISIKAYSKGGHSSKPGKETSLAKVSKAIYKICNNPLKPKLIKPMLHYLEATKPFIIDEKLKNLVENISENKKGLLNHFVSNENTMPYVITTNAATMLNGGSSGCNVLPQTVEAIINFRSMPNDTCDKILEHCKKVCDDDVEITLLRGLDPSKISKIDSYGYDELKKCIQSYFKDIEVVPFYVVGGTDSRYYEEICDTILRFRPYFGEIHLHDTVHATNERCEKQSYLYGIKFMIDFMEKTCF